MILGRTQQGSPGLSPTPLYWVLIARFMPSCVATFGHTEGVRKGGPEAAVISPLDLSSDVGMDVSTCPCAKVAYICLCMQDMTYMYAGACMSHDGLGAPPGGTFRNLSELPPCFRSGGPSGRSRPGRGSSGQQAGAGGSWAGWQGRLGGAADPAPGGPGRAAPHSQATGPGPLSLHEIISGSKSMESPATQSPFSPAPIHSPPFQAPSSRDPSTAPKPSFDVREQRTAIKCCFKEGACTALPSVRES